ncbi:MAG TPA: ROK family protein, partial [Spirochaetia bacterium]|nr:ROK family protein [Spirochaetia bacterium]
AIARKARRSIVKVIELVTTLKSRDAIRVVGKTKTSGGRPSFVYQVNPDLVYTVGVSVWTDKLIASVVNATLDVVYEETIPFELPADLTTHSDYLVDQITATVQRITKTVCLRKLVGGVGIALPGMVDSDRGIWFAGLQISGISHIPLSRLLTERLSLPVFVEDIARTLAFREMRQMSGKRPKHFVFLYLGFGMGTGVIINRRLYKGYHGLAGEIGHVEHADNNYRCSCNNVGCLETILSIGGVRRLFADRLTEGVRSILQVANGGIRPESPTIQEIYDAARQEDRFTIMTLTEIGRFLGDSCATLVKLFNPQRIYVGGPLAIFRPYFQQPVDEVLSRHALPEMLENFRVEFLEYEPKNEAQGAGFLALDRFCHSLTRLPSSGSRR